MAIHENASTSGRSRGREIALNVGAVAGLICVLAAAASFLFGIKPLVFRSGSMSPDIPTGALALSKATPAADLAVGDVVSVENEQGVRITHRIQDVVSADGTSAVLILKGDANKDADISPYTVTEADRVFFSVPGLGYAVSWLSSPAAIFLGGAFVGGLMVLTFGPASKRNDDDSDPDDSQGGDGTADAHAVVEQSIAHAHSGVDAPTAQLRTSDFAIRRFLPARTMMAFGAVGVAALSVATVGTSAAFTDSSTATSSFAAAANFYPTPLVSNVTCSTSGTVGFRKATVSWTAPAGSPPLGGAWNYRVIVRRDNNASEVIDTYNQTSTTLSGYRAGSTGRGYIVEVHTVNGPNVSTGWNGQGIWSGAVLDTYCSGGASGQPNPAGENSVTGQGVESQSLRMAMGASPSPESVAASATTTPVTTTPAATSEAAPTTTIATTASGTPTPTVPATTTTTVEKATTTTESTTAPTTTTTEDAAPAPAPSGDLVIANISTSGNYTATVSGTTATITNKSGAQVFAGTVGKKATVQWASDSDRLWIIDGDTLSVVDAASGSVTTVDPSSDQVPAEIAMLVTN